MKHILQFAFFFHQPLGYVLKSDTVRAQLEAQRDESRRKHCPLNEDGSYPPGLCYRPCFTFDDGKDCRTDLNFDALPSIFAEMVLKDYHDIIIRHNFYKKGIVFIVDMEVDNELYDQPRNDTFDDLFGRYEWTEYNIQTVEINGQPQLKRFISELTLEDIQEYGMNHPIEYRIFEEE